jgi:predicted ATPase
LNKLITASLKDDRDTSIEIQVEWDFNDSTVFSKTSWRWFMGNQHSGPFLENSLGGSPPEEVLRALVEVLKSFQIYSFDGERLAANVGLAPDITLSSNGSNLAGVLDNLRDKEPERFEALNEELRRWLPEFDRILFETPGPGLRSILLRTRSGHRIEASDLSHGTLFALGFITLAHLPNPPSIVCFEEPERGIHPRLLREVRDAMYRLCYPEEYGEKRAPVQVIATTHSPYFLDLYKDHPEEIVIAHKDEKGVHFERLSDKPNVDEFLQDAPLGEVWYSGILGGVPSNP